jgi:hypothetical protein
MTASSEWKAARRAEKLAMWALALGGLAWLLQPADGAKATRPSVKLLALTLPQAARSLGEEGALRLPQTFRPRDGKTFFGGSIITSPSTGSYLSLLE